MKKYIGVYVILRKTRDRFEGNHPNGFNRGKMVQGFLKVLETGKPCIIAGTKMGFSHTQTSNVIRIDNRGFETENGYYILIKP